MFITLQAKLYYWLKIFENFNFYSMELKKSPKADLENKKFIFWEIGLAVALLLTFLAFEWKVDTAQAETFQTLADEEAEEEIIPITRAQLKPPPPPPPAPKITDVLNIVDDDQELEDELEIEDVEAEQDTEVEIQEVGETSEEYGEEEIFVVVENMPEFPGGTKALNKFIAKTVRYPVIAQENGITGRVFVGFVIDKDGSVSNVKVLRPVDPALDKEAIRVIKAMPKWKPGKQRGKPVRVSYTVPINFQLN